MLISRIIGGMGNQMFQYAAGLQAARVRGVPFAIDVTPFSSGAYRLWPYRLDRLRIAAPLAASEEIMRARGWNESWISRAALKATRILIPHYPARWLREESKGSAIRFANDRMVRYLDGYWQSEKWFLDVAAEVRAEFSFVESPSGRNKEMAETISRTEAVSVHVRRGDYASNAVNLAKHGLMGREYYRNAISLISRRFRDVSFFFFSDDPQWVREQFRDLDNAIFVDHNDKNNGHEDLRLMSLCRHHVIANSTLSWWGAWLGEGKDSVVIAPVRWYSGSVHTSYSIIPDRWISL